MNELNAVKAILEDSKDEPIKQLEFIKLTCANEQNPFHEAHQRDKVFIKTALEKSIIYFKEDFTDQHYEHILGFSVQPLGNKVSFLIETYKKQFVVVDTRTLPESITATRFTVGIKLNYLYREIKAERKVNIAHHIKRGR